MFLDIQKNVLLKNLSTYSIGGPCRYYIPVKNIEDLKSAFLFVKQKAVPYFILGRGSNVLFDDEGYTGAILHMKDDKVTIEKNRLIVSAGSFLPTICRLAAEDNLSGFEYFSGIPGTVGGALVMNAGSEGWSISSFLEKVTFMHEDGLIQVYDAKDITFGYRYSSFRELKGAILNASFLLSSGLGVKKRFEYFLEKRKKSQPSNPNAGCIFKNPKGNFAGRLIELSGLKGISIGGAKISERHANFIINENKASSKDVLDLIDLIKKRVKKKYSIDLEEEILYISSFEG